jgi:predicted aldo/keto reductase-like oxidoreductase
MREILEVYSDASPLSPSELSTIEEIKTGLGTSWCHRCDYCQPCPQKIRISTVLSARSMTRRMPLGRTREILDPAMKAAASCIECGLCVERCPYDLAVPELLKERQGQYSGFLETGLWQ